MVIIYFFQFLSTLTLYHFNGTRKLLRHQIFSADVGNLGQPISHVIICHLYMMFLCYQPCRTSWAHHHYEGVQAYNYKRVQGPVREQKPNSPCQFFQLKFIPSRGYVPCFFLFLKPIVHFLLLSICTYVVLQLLQQLSPGMHWCRFKFQLGMRSTRTSQTTSKVIVGTSYHTHGSDNGFVTWLF